MMNEKISALIDREICPDERGELFDHILIDDSAHRLWQRYHLIGSVLRGEVEQTGPDLCERIRSRIENEPTVLAPTNRAALPDSPARNDIWKSAGLLAIAASVALMAVITLKPAYNELSTQTASLDATALEASSKAKFEQEFGEMLVQHGEFTSSPGLNGLITYAKLVSNDPME